jgi:hypothetical protein
MTVNRFALGAVAAAAALVVSGGAALASTGNDDRGSDDRASCQARLAKIAERRGLTVAQLEADVKTRLLARIDAALAAGRITSDQAATLRERISNAAPCSRPVRRAIRRHVRHHFLSLAAGYLDLTPKELRAQLPGTSLAALAVKNGKTVDGLVGALVAPAKNRLAKAVSAQKLTQAQADARLAELQQRVEKLVEKSFPAKP